MKTEIELRPAAEENTLAANWIVISQTQSSRVVYVTDDVDYQPPSHGDWYCVNTYRGPLPESMTSHNCWRWRFDGGAFVDATARVN